MSEGRRERKVVSVLFAASTLEIARAGRVETEELVRATRLALRDAGDRAVSLNVFAAAAREYDRALELWPEDDQERPRLLLNAAEARVQAERWDPDELEKARDALVAAGDHSGVAEAEILRAEVLWNLGRGDEIPQSLERTAALAADMPRSATKARIYAGLFRLHWLASRMDLAEPFEAQALAMADELDLKEIRANILSASGALRAARGDPEGLNVLEESIRLFEELNLADSQRPHNNLADSYYNLGDLSQAAEATKRMKEAWKRFVSPDWLRWADSQEIRLMYHAGHWDEALALAESRIAQTSGEQTHYLDASWRWERGRILLARGDVTGALEESAAGLERAQVVGDPQIVIPLTAFRVYALWAAGDDHAKPLARELVEALVHDLLPVAHDWFAELAVAMASLGLGTEVEAVAQFVPTPTPWREGGRALGRGDPVAAAEIFGRMNSKPLKAEARLIAARDGLEVDLSAAIEFFEEVGASRYLAEAEALLTKSRSA
jgi:tetratricopeptide (TPR) repeat protein